MNFRQASKTIFPFWWITAVLLTFLALTQGCEHDPYPAPPPGMGNDSITPPDTTDPNDTTSPGGKPCHPDTAYFERDILPILSANCAYAGCHNAASAQKGVVLTNYQTVMATADVRPGNLSGSDLYEVITDSDPGDRMPPPPNAPLTNAQITLIRDWILQGAQNLKCDDCDTTDVSFQDNIAPIFASSCQSCHSGSNPPNGQLLVSYQNIKDGIVGGEVMERIRHDPGYNPMPPSGIKLDPCKIELLESWIRQGLPNN